MGENDLDRLESWKEIASFIERDKRTAMRWAKQGMPIRRIRGRVYASRAEIKRWLSTHPEQVSNQELANGTPSALREPARRKWVWAGAVAVLATLALGLVLISSSRTILRPKLPAKVTFTENGFDALDAAGHEVWNHRYPFRLDGAAFRHSESMEDLVRIDDFRGDGDREVLVVAPLRTSSNPEAPYKIEVDFFSSRGKLLWSYVPQNTFQFGEHTLHGPWSILDVLISDQAPKKKIWVVAAHTLWGNSFVVQLDSDTGSDSVRFVNTGVIYKINEVKNSKGMFLLAAGFNNEYDSGTLALIDQNKTFAASPQTSGTRHQCLSCPPGTPDYYLVFPRSEINQVEKAPEDPLRRITVTDREIEVSKFELEAPKGSATIYSFRTQPAIEPVSLRYDSRYDMLHRELSAQKKLDHSLENCPERMHPKPVRMWTPAGGWIDLPIKPAKAND